MYSIIRFEAGLMAEAVILAEGPNRLRVAVAGFPETFELTRTGGDWHTELGHKVEFDCLLAADRGEVGTVQERVMACAATYPVA